MVLKLRQPLGLPLTLLLLKMCQRLRGSLAIARCVFGLEHVYSHWLFPLLWYGTLYLLDLSHCLQDLFHVAPVACAVNKFFDILLARPWPSRLGLLDSELQISANKKSSPPQLDKARRSVSHAHRFHAAAGETPPQKPLDEARTPT